MMNIFYQKLSRLLEKRQTIPTGSRSPVENHCFKQICLESELKGLRIKIVLQRHHCIELQCLWNLILVVVWFVKANVVKCT